MEGESEPHIKEGLGKGLQLFSCFMTMERIWEAGYFLTLFFNLFFFPEKIKSRISALLLYFVLTVNGFGISCEISMFNLKQQELKL